MIAIPCSYIIFPTFSPTIIEPLPSNDSLVKVNAIVSPGVGDKLEVKNACAGFAVFIPLGLKEYNDKSVPCKLDVM